MALLKRQSTATALEIFDDQGPTMWGTFVGNWTLYNAKGFNNNTLTATPTPGASLSFTFSGSQAWLYGSLSSVDNTTTIENATYPTADYLIDDFPAGSQKPWVDSTGAIVYFQTPKLADGTHEIDITVTSANATNQFVLDFFLVSPLLGETHSGVTTTRDMPTSTSTSSSLPIVAASSAPVGAIVGGVVGGIAGIVLLVAAVWFFMRRRSRGGQAYYFDKPTPGDILAGEDHVEPFDANATTPAVRQSVASPHSSRFSQSGPSETTGITYVSGNTSQPRTGKAALMAQQHQDVQQPVQHQDAGVRFNADGEPQEAGPSHLPNEVPPTYTPN